MNNHNMKGDLNLICICVNSYYYAQITVFKDKTKTMKDVTEWSGSMHALELLPKLSLIKDYL